MVDSIVNRLGELTLLMSFRTRHKIAPQGQQIVAQGKQTRVPRAFVPPWVNVKGVVGRANSAVSIGGWPRPKDAAARLRPRSTTARRHPSLLGRHSLCRQTQGGGKARKTRLALPWAVFLSPFGAGYYTAARTPSGALRLVIGSLGLGHSAALPRHQPP